MDYLSTLDIKKSIGPDSMLRELANCIAKLGSITSGSP